jgi:MFS superfamily sulfate permease-like transporter
MDSRPTGRRPRRRRATVGDRHEALRADLLASFVVFLVALPLCVGIAVACGVPAELGLLTGVVGGLVTGAMRGSHLQVSGPAAGLTVLVYETVHAYGLAALGAVVLATGLAQIALGLLRLGRWFRAISTAVVLGMLTGIGLVIVGQQVYPMLDRPQHGSTAANFAGLPRLVLDAAADPRAQAAGALGLGTIAILLTWPRLPRRVRTLPASLAAVAVAIAVAAAFDLPVARLEVEGLFESLNPTGLGDLARLTEIGLLGSVVTFTLIASAETLFCAAAVDRMVVAGPQTDYDRELVAQGTGNALCGLLGALPMTAVIVRSAANVQAGARTRNSRMLHGLWLLLAAAALPEALEAIPLAVLAAVLVHAGVKLVAAREARRLWRSDRGELLVLVVTAVAVVATNLFEGVLIGIALALAKTAWDVSHVRIEVDRSEPTVCVRLTGNATFLRLPHLLDSLDALPRERPVSLCTAGLRHLDEAYRSALLAWAERHGAPVTEARTGDSLAPDLVGTPER